MPHYNYSDNNDYPNNNYAVVFFFFIMVVAMFYMPGCGEYSQYGGRTIRVEIVDGRSIKQEESLPNGS